MTDAELRCTPRGQVLLMDGAKSVYAVNAEREIQLAQRGNRLWVNTPVPEMRNPYPPDRGHPQTRGITRAESPTGGHGNTQRLGGRETHHPARAGIFLPALQFAPGGRKTGPAVLYLHESDLAADASAAGRSTSFSRTEGPCWRSACGARARRSRLRKASSAMSAWTGRTCTRPTCWAGRMWACGGGCAGLCPLRRRKKWQQGRGTGGHGQRGGAGLARGGAGASAIRLGETVADIGVVVERRPCPADAEPVGQRRSRGPGDVRSARPCGYARSETHLGPAG